MWVCSHVVTCTLTATGDQTIAQRDTIPCNNSRAVFWYTVSPQLGVNSATVSPSRGWSKWDSIKQAAVAMLHRWWWWCYPFFFSPSSSLVNALTWHDSSTLSSKGLRVARWYWTWHAAGLLSRGVLRILPLPSMFPFKRDNIVKCHLDVKEIKGSWRERLQCLIATVDINSSWMFHLGWCNKDGCILCLSVRFCFGKCANGEALIHVWAWKYL